MKSIEDLKLSKLNKDSIEIKQMNQLVGGTYCYNGPDNQSANENEGKCSCVCISDVYAPYYGFDGFYEQASSMKYK